MEVGGGGKERERTGEEGRWEGETQHRKKAGWKESRGRRENVERRKKERAEEKDGEMVREVRGDWKR
jgi:hypothetical protein